MYNADTEVFFPLRVAAQLRGMRGDLWNEIVDRVTSENASLKLKGAFVLLMIRLSGCVNCNSDSFRAMKGCSQCGKQSVRRFRGLDQELLDLFMQYQKEVEVYLKKTNG